MKATGNFTWLNEIITGFDEILAPAVQLRTLQVHCANLMRNFSHDTSTLLTFKISHVITSSFLSVPLSVGGYFRKLEYNFNSAFSDKVIDYDYLINT